MNWHQKRVLEIFRPPQPYPNQPWCKQQPWIEPISREWDEGLQYFYQWCCGSNDALYLTLQFVTSSAYNHLGHKDAADIWYKTSPFLPKRVSCDRWPSRTRWHNPNWTVEGTFSRSVPGASPLVPNENRKMKKEQSLLDVNRSCFFEVLRVFWRTTLYRLLYLS